MKVFHYAQDTQPVGWVSPYRFQYVIDLRCFLSLKERMSWSQGRLMHEMHSEIMDFIFSMDDCCSDRNFNWLYLHTMHDDWLALSKLHGKKWDRGIIEVHCISGMR